MYRTVDLNQVSKNIENWYNSEVLCGINPVSMVISSKDEQLNLIKAYHRITYTLNAIGIKDGESFTTTLVETIYNYNHGTTTEKEAHSDAFMDFLMDVSMFIGNLKATH